MGKPIYGHFAHILHKEKWYIKSLCYNWESSLFKIWYNKKKNPET